MFEEIGDYLGYLRQHFILIFLFEAFNVVLDAALAVNECELSLNDFIKLDKS